MVLRKGKLWKECSKCGRMYPATTKKRGLCKKCKKHSWLDDLVK